jgi:hypothetical protein
LQVLKGETPGHWGDERHIKDLMKPEEDGVPELAYFGLVKM